MRTAIRLAGALVFAGMVWYFPVAAASALPTGRQYEMVSPVFKGGYAATVRLATALDGESVIYYSNGAFNGAPFGFENRFDYLARRSAMGWSTVPLMAPPGLIAKFDESDFSQSLDQEFFIGEAGSSGALYDPDEADLLLHATSLPDSEPNWEPVGSVENVQRPHELLSPGYRASSLNFCHVLLAATGQALLQQAVGAREPLYEFSRGCDGEAASLRLIALSNTGALMNPMCHIGVGGSQYSEQSSEFNAMSEDGESVYFTVCVSGEETGTSSPHQLFMRLDGTRTLEISRPLGKCSVPGEVPCADAATRASADFVGASEDGSTVYFTTSAPLAVADKDSASDLYVSTIGCPTGKPECVSSEREVRSLVQVSRDANGDAGEVLGVVRVAPDGSRVYYVATGIPFEQGSIEKLEQEGRPVPRLGSANLYVYDHNSGTTAFIGDLCTGSEVSGSAQDARCPSGESDSSLWSRPEPEAQSAGADARFLVFTSVAQLSGDDTNAVKDVYRYDTETDALQRVSVGENGADANGNASQFGSEIHPSHWGGPVYDQYEMDSRAVSEDGSRVVFTSAAPLSSAATNGLTNAYEWHETADGVSLVSTGVSGTPVNEVVISPNGRSVFFLTTQGLVPQDTDGASDVYDARLEGGFAPVPVTSGPCQGDACQGPLTNPAPLLVPGSIAQAPGANFAAPKPVKPTKKKATAKKRVKKKRAKAQNRRDRQARNVSRQAATVGKKVGGRGR